MFVSLFSPDLQDELRIESIILRMYNKNPAVFINIKLNTFITKVAEILYDVSKKLFQISQNEDVSQLANSVKTMRSTTTSPSKGGRSAEHLSNKQKQFHYLNYKGLLSLTTLLLSVEQLIYNEFNPNLLQTKKEEKLDGQALLGTKMVERSTDQI